MVCSDALDNNALDNNALDNDVLDTMDSAAVYLQVYLKMKTRNT
jgi:hypothetical protein